MCIATTLISTRDVSFNEVTFPFTNVTGDQEDVDGWLTELFEPQLAPEACAPCVVDLHDVEDLNWKKHTNRSLQQDMKHNKGRKRAVWRLHVCTNHHHRSKTCCIF